MSRPLSVKLILNMKCICTILQMFLSIFHELPSHCLKVVLPVKKNEHIVEAVAGTNDAVIK